MGGTLERRVGDLERRAGVRENSEFCSCPGPVTVTVDWGDDPEPPAICPRCGRPGRVVVVEWDDGPDSAAVWGAE